MLKNKQMEETKIHNLKSLFPNMLIKEEKALLKFLFKEGVYSDFTYIINEMYNMYNETSVWKRDFASCSVCSIIHRVFYAWVSNCKAMTICMRGIDERWEREYLTIFANDIIEEWENHLINICDKYKNYMNLRRNYYDNGLTLSVPFCCRESVLKYFRKRASNRLQILFSIVDWTEIKYDTFRVPYLQPKGVRIKLNIPSEFIKR